MGDAATELDRLFAIDLERVLDVALEGAFPDVEELVRRDPAQAAETILASAARHAGVRDAVRRVERLSPLLEEDGLRRLLAELAGSGVAAAVAVADEFSHLGGVADLVPTDGLVAAVRSLPENGPLDDTGQAAHDLLTGAAVRFDWGQIAELLEAAMVPGERTSWLDEALDRQAWAHPEGLGPVTDMSNDVTTGQAAAHAAAVDAAIRSWVAGGRSPAGWIRLLGSALPGCGEPTCCRTGRFEDALYQRGIFARAGRVPEIREAGAP